MENKTMKNHLWDSRILFHSGNRYPETPDPTFLKSVLIYFTYQSGSKSPQKTVGEVIFLGITSGARMRLPNGAKCCPVPMRLTTLLRPPLFTS